MGNDGRIQDDTHHKLSSGVLLVVSTTLDIPPFDIVPDPLPC